VLAEYARSRDATVVLLADLPVVAVLIDFLDLREVRIAADVNPPGGR
jgi:hypothetical protein